jgi:predicted ATPase
VDEIDSAAEPVEKKSLRFTSVVIGNWRNFTHVDVPIRSRVFLVGPNASGKSNFLDVFRFLSEIVTVGGGFESAIKKRGGVKMLRSFAARRQPAVSIHVTMGDDRVPDEWSYELTFKQDKQRRPEIEKEVVCYRGKVLVERPDSHDIDDPDRLRQTHLEQVNVNKKFRDVADFFATVRYMHVVPQLVREPERSVGRLNDPFGGDFLEQIARSNVQTRESRLKRIVQALTVAVPQLEKLELEHDVRGVPHLKGRYQHWRMHGAWQSEEHFSDGTLRLLGLLWAVMDGSGPLLLEEPELSLHPEVVSYIPQMFSRVQRRLGRQILVSSHSPEILNDPGIGTDEVLYLSPMNEGTSISLLRGNKEVEGLVSAGVPLGEALQGMTAPKQASQLSLFGKR